MLKRHCHRGFTLLETLVTLTLISLISALLMGTLHHVYQLQLRLEKRDNVEERKEFGQRWFRDIVSGLQTDRTDAPNVLRGTPNRLAGLTTSPLSVNRIGMITPFVLETRLERNDNTVYLDYSSGNERFTLLTVSNGELSLEYTDINGTSHDEWPPRNETAQLPALVSLRITTPDAKAIWIAHPESASHPLPSVQLLFGAPGSK